MKRVSASVRQRVSAIWLWLLALWCAGALALHVATNASADVVPDPIVEVEAAYLRGEYALVAQVGEQLMAPPELADRQDHLWYVIGMAQLQRRQFAEAGYAFQQVITRFPESPRRPDVEIGLAEVQWQTGDPQAAVAQYDAWVAHWGSGHPAAIRAHYNLGMAARAAGQWDKARAAFQEIVQRHPMSFEATLAQQVLQHGEFAFSVQVGAFGVRANAARLQRELVRRGYAAIVDQTTADGRPIYRVRVGQVATRDEALQSAARLRQDGFPAKVVP